MTARTETLKPPRTGADGSAADRAIALGRAGRERLPERHRESFDAVLDAFEHYEAGRDDAAREKLAVIGLSSPFLEWKLALRGLLAYAAGDNGRALDNWNRLEPRRLPARMIAPLRIVIDPAFMAGKSARLLRGLQSAGEQMRGEVWNRLRELQAELVRPDRLHAAVAKVPEIVPLLRRDAPELAAALPKCFYAAAMSGHPDGARLLRRHFDPPADDPHWARLQALAAERRGEWATALRHWERYSADIDLIFTPADRPRAKALVWLRCADMAAREPGRRTISPVSTEDYLKRALTAEPDNVEAHRRLFECYRDTDRAGAAVVVGTRLVALDPDDAESALDLTELLREQGQIDSAIEQCERVRALDPFDARVTVQLADLLRTRARHRAAAGDIATAEADFRRSESLERKPPRIARLVLHAMIDYLRNNAAAGDQASEAARAIDAPAAAFAMMTESVRLRLPRPMRQQFDAEWHAARSGPLSNWSIIALTETALQHSLAPTYRGSKTHLAQIRQAVERSIPDFKSVAEAEHLCSFLDALEWTRHLRLLARVYTTRYPAEPAFPYYECRSYLAERTPRGSHVGLTRLIRARELAVRQAEKTGSDDWLRRIDELGEEYQMPAPTFADFLGALGGDDE